MIEAGAGTSRVLPREGAIREGYGVPVIAPGSVRLVTCNFVPVEQVVAYSCPQGWVLCRMGRHSRAMEVTAAPGRSMVPVLLRLDGRVEVA